MNRIPRTLIISLATCFAAGMSYAADPADPAASHPIKQARKKVAKASHTAASATKSGLLKAEGGLERGAGAVAGGVESGAHAMGRGADKVAGKVGLTPDAKK